MSRWQRWWCALVVRVSRRVPAYQHLYELKWNSADDEQEWTRLPRRWCFPHTGSRVLGERLFWAYIDECTPREEEPHD